MYEINLFASKRRQSNASSPNMAAIGGVIRGRPYPHVIEWVSLNKSSRSSRAVIILLVLAYEKLTNFLFFMSRVW